MTGYMGAPKAVILDADDTLWDTRSAYDEALAECRSYAARHGVDPDEWSRRQREIDLALIDRLGFSRNRFPTAAVRAWTQLSGDSNDSPRARRVRAAADGAFARPARLIHGAEEAVGAVSSDGWAVGLVARGDYEVQQKRLRDVNRLAHMLDYVDVVTHKNCGTFLRAAASLDVDPSRCVSVGNSLRSDIEPALEARMQAVWIFDAPHPCGGVPDGVAVLQSTEGLPGLLTSLTDG